MQQIFHVRTLKKVVFVFKLEMIKCLILSPFLNMVEKEILELCAIKIDLRECDVIVICLYRSPTGDFYQFLHLLDCMLMHLHKL